MRNFLGSTAIAVASIVMASGIVAFADPANATVAGGIVSSAIVQAPGMNPGFTAGLATAERRRGSRQS